MDKISIRNSKFAKTGLQDMIDYMNKCSGVLTKKMNMVEIGSYVGDSTKIFAENFESIICVDPYQNGYDDKDSSSYVHPMKKVLLQFRMDVLQVYDNVSLMVNTSMEAVSHFRDMSIDFVYIDGNHTKESIINDLHAWNPKVCLWLGGHDYANKNAPAVKPEVDKFIGNGVTIFKDTSWLARK